MTWTIDCWDQANSFRSRISQQFVHFCLGQGLAIWIVIVGLGSFEKGLFHVIAGIGLAISFHRHIIEDEAHAIVSDKEVQVRVA